MKTKTGILALGLFTLTGVVVVSCGGSSDSGDTTTGGTTSTSGNGTGGSVSGNTSSGGTANNTSGTANNTGGTANNTSGTDTGGTANGGTTNNNGGQNSNNSAGAPDAGAANAAGGAGPAPGCPATQPADGSMCMQLQGPAGFLGCDYDTMNCRCQRRNGTRTWQCTDTAGAGGAGPGGAVTCPANGKTGDACTGGPGLCAGQRCFCNNDMLTCF